MKQPIRLTRTQRETFGRLYGIDVTKVKGVIKDTPTFIEILTGEDEVLKIEK